jgi:hypothetical protein
MHQAKNFVPRIWRILGGGIVASYDGELAEKMFHLPCVGPTSRKDWSSPLFKIIGTVIFLTGVV